MGGVTVKSLSEQREEGVERVKSLAPWQFGKQNYSSVWFRDWGGHVRDGWSHPQYRMLCSQLGVIPVIFPASFTLRWSILQFEVLFDVHTQEFDVTYPLHFRTQFLGTVCWRCTTQPGFHIISVVFLIAVVDENHWRCAVCKHDAEQGEDQGIEYSSMGGPPAYELSVRKSNIQLLKEVFRLCKFSFFINHINGFYSSFVLQGSRYTWSIYSAVLECVTSLQQHPYLKLSWLHICIAPALLPSKFPGISKNWEDAHPEKEQ